MELIDEYEISKQKTLRYLKIKKLSANKAI